MMSDLDDLIESSTTQFGEISVRTLDLTKLMEAASFEFRKPPALRAIAADQLPLSGQSLAEARKSKLRIVAGWIVVAMAILVYFIFRFSSQLHLFGHGWIAWIVLAVAAVAMYLWAAHVNPRMERRRSQLEAAIAKNTAPSADYARAADPRPPILFLRPFKDDLLTSGVLRFEEDLAAHLRLLGPPIAIGNPKDDLPELGAYRQYYDEATWKSAVLGYMRECRFIFMIPGSTMAVEWEIDTIIVQQLLQKLFFVFPDEDEERGAKRFQTVVARFRDTAYWRPLRSLDITKTRILHFCDTNTITNVRCGTLSAAFWATNLGRETIRAHDERPSRLRLQVRQATTNANPVLAVLTVIFLSLAGISGAPLPVVALVSMFVEGPPDWTLLGSLAAIATASSVGFVLSLRALNKRRAARRS